MAKPVKFSGSKSKVKGGSTSFNFGYNVAPGKSKGGKSQMGGSRGGGGGVGNSICGSFPDPCGFRTELS